MVYYTLDGSDPTVAGRRGIHGTPWQRSRRRRCCERWPCSAGVPVSGVTTATYLVGEGTGLPVVSLVTEPAHLWDTTTGIYVNAEGARPVLGAAGGTVEWLSPGGETWTSCVGAGLRIHGGNISRSTCGQAVVPAVLPGGVRATRVRVPAIWV